VKGLLLCPCRRHNVRSVRGKVGVIRRLSVLRPFIVSVSVVVVAVAVGVVVAVSVAVAWLPPP